MSLISPELEAKGRKPLPPEKSGITLTKVENPQNKILGLNKPVFYGVVGVALISIGAGIFFYVKKHKK